jgi:DNA-binding NarL/FixJ family response regulator
MAAPGMSIRILIADDHPIFLDGLCFAIRSQYPDIDIVAAVNNGKEAVTADARLKPDVVLLDIKMPILDGLEAARQICQNRADARILMLTTFDDHELISDALKAGAIGYLLKESTIEEVVFGIRSIFRGNLLVPSAAMQRSAGTPTVPDAPEPAPVAELLPLSRKEQYILRLLLTGKASKEIAATVFLSEGTVRNYIHHIYQVIGVGNRTSLLLWAMKHGITGAG